MKNINNFPATMITLSISPRVISIPTLGANSVTATALLTDQFGYKIMNEAVVYGLTWTPDGVSIDPATGVITVTPEAEEVVLTVTGRSSSLLATAAIMLRKYESPPKPGVQISLGSGHGLAIKPDGTVWAWGNNIYGQLGDGTTTHRSTPVQVSGLTDVVSVAGGWAHSLAIKFDGTVWTWGNNSNGQLGDGTATNRLTPVQIMTDVVSVAGGWGQGLAIKSDGTVWAWGRNDYGQLGDGTRTRRLTPVQVIGLTD